MRTADDMRALNARRYPVPVAPVLRIVEQWLGGQPAAENVGGNAMNTDLLPMSPIDVLATRCGRTRSSLERGLNRLRYAPEARMSVEFADQLIAATYGPQLWRTDPELHEIRRQLPSRNVDEPLMTDTEIAEWAVGVWASMTPGEWQGFRAAVLELAPDGDSAERERWGRLLEPMVVPAEAAA